MQDDGKTLFDFLPGRSAAPESDDPFDAPAPDESDPALTELVLTALRTVRDPEIPVNLVDLGLIYTLAVGRDGRVLVEMTLTSPTCPVAEALPGDVERAIRTVEGVTDVKVRLSWTPSWHPGMMSDEAKLELGLL